MRSAIQIEVPEGVDPFVVHTTEPKRTALRKFRALLKTLMAASLIGSRPTHPTARVGTAQAFTSVTAAAAQAADTVTLNGQALTATQLNATGTVTCASVSVADTVTLGGVVFTAAATEDTTIGQFAQITSDTATAVSLVACIAAAAGGTGAGRITNALYGLVDAVNAAGVVTIRARTGGTAGNSITLVSSNGGRLAVSAATLANGAAVASNQFDYVGTNAQTAAELARAIAASGTALVSGLLIGSNRKGTFTLASMAAGDTVTIGAVSFQAVTSGGDGTDNWGNPARFSIAGTDTADATALKNAINAHPYLKDRVLATSAAAVVTVYAIPDPLQTGLSYPDSLYKLAQTGGHVTVAAMGSSAECSVWAIQKGTAGNQATIASSNAGRLAILAAASRLSGGTVTNFTL